MVLVEDSKAYRWWCNHFLRRKAKNILVKKDCSTISIRKDLDQSHVNHHWKTSTLESCGDHSITRSLSSGTIASSLLHACFSLIEVYKIILGFEFQFADFKS